ncbi:alpha-mannosidase [Paenibacillus motobuensis]|uniref:alpha-mannosidase n=1 Tax=Paenibacillus TaxID=44249 RepID=UPI00203BC2BE|nr:MULTISPECIES: alpha-mannosidase [Paenibacillus]MCM3042791.1 alpha-mannosidase [Paenibacillus lutimineralis]MCM3649895.1 alpha-mannosidase [Paenibacillus motobuensis]
MERIKRFIRELSECQWLEQHELRDWEIISSTYKLPGQYVDEAPFTEGDDFDLFPSKQGTTYFFRMQLEIPQEWMQQEGRHIGLIFQSGGEGLLRINGKSYQGLDRNHSFVTLSNDIIRRPLKLEIELFDPVPEPVDPLNQQAVIQPPIRSIYSSIVSVNRPVQQLMYTAKVIRDSAVLLPEQDFRRVRLIEALYQAMDEFVALDRGAIREGSRVAAIDDRLGQKVLEIGGNAEGLIHMVGQSHIDIAWLWPARETVRKTSRTFSTVDALMDEYPEYRYAQSQPQLFEYLKDNDPELYERVKRRIEEGRWELVGGMWVEPDLNIPSGESLMRQMLYGQRFYEEEFGRSSNIEWLPDTFGYCASLPQILKHGSIEYFMTTKLGWNDTNVFPYDLFYWVGIDGTPMLSYLNHGVNENTLPKDVHEHWQSYREKANHNEQMLLYGHGDGGGGVTREMLEYIHRSELMVGQPASQFSSAADFFAGISDAKPQLPSWRGDLYLELHRGTYTTHSRNKRNNRQAEVLYREAELWSTLAGPGLDSERGREIGSAMHKGWKLILLNQFHDIIPGSAITETYETSMKEYREIFELGNNGLRQALKALADQVNTEAEGKPYIVFNSLGWNRNAIIEIAGADCHGELAVFDGSGLRLQHETANTSEGSQVILVQVPDVPAFGYKTIWLKQEGTKILSSSDRKSGDLLAQGWETGYYRVRFNEQGEIISLYDKAAEREILLAGARANRFHFFHDRPTLWDAWDIDSRYEEQPAGDAELLEMRLHSTGPVRDVLRFRWKLNESEISQDMILYHQDRRIDFKTRVEWNETHKLLKVGFPVDIVTVKATYEIPFGALERPTHRNTSWEQAQYEVCGHRFVDVSEHGYGVSLLNDCKYGYDVQGSTIRLSLLRAPKWPDSSADLGEHEFTYSLYPHTGNWREAHTLRRAAELNHAAEVVEAELGPGTLPSEQSLIRFTGQHVILDTVKPSEDGQASILRLYESSGGREKITLQWPQSCNGIYLSDALEHELEAIDPQDGLIELQFAPYEIKTIRINN